MIGETIERLLLKRGFNVVSSSGLKEALEHLRHKQFDLIIVNLHRADKTDLELFEQIKVRGGEKLVLIAVGEESDQTIDLKSPGASECIKEPFQLEELARTVEQALARSRELQAEVNGRGAQKGSINKDGSKTKSGSSLLTGRSTAIRKIITTIGRIAATESSVLITGATGTGKELVARAIHEQSRRCNAPFIDINCSAIPDTLIESELFGHQRGTFTGAHETRRGLFQEASGGTLFLDEVDALGLPAQAKLLRVLQERQIRRVGGRENIPIDVRIISATNRNIQLAASEGTFRLDLLFRLRVVPLHMPELRERGDEDITLLVEHCLGRHIRRHGLPPRRFSAEAMHALVNYRWPGNVRELENAVEYALAIGINEELGLGDLPPDIVDSLPDSIDLLDECLNNDAPLAEIEQRYILSMFERCGRHQIKTAMTLGIDRRTLYRKLQQYGVIVYGEESPLRRLL
jgi:DNA-binding NtrC family response regulator